MMEKHYLGIDIGGTKIKTVILDQNREILEQKEILTEENARDRGLWKKKVLDIINEKTKELVHNDENLLKCGISAPGLVDVENRKILHMPERLQGIENFDWSAELNRDIRILNDGHSACLAEYECFYASKGVRNMLMVTLGTGVGGGIIIDGKLFQGNMQRAGHVGHMTIDHNAATTMTNMVGSLEYAVGNFSVGERTHEKFNSVRDLVSAYENGDSLATYWWLSSIQKLATALASLANIFSPEMIVLGGGITAGASQALMGPLNDFMSLYEWRPGGQQVTVLEAKHEAYAGAIGAAFFAKSKQDQ